jgi:hypothetical protein
LSIIEIYEKSVSRTPEFVLLKSQLSSMLTKAETKLSSSSSTSSAALPKTSVSLLSAPADKSPPRAVSHFGEHARRQEHAQPALQQPHTHISGCKNGGQTTEHDSESDSECEQEAVVGTKLKIT